MAQSQSSSLKIGTRGSPLALAQVREVRERLVRSCGLDPAQIEVTVIRTTGDVIQDRPLAEAGGKGLFTKEIEEALLSGTIDLAVHSSKDVPTIMPPGLALVAFLPREDPRDAFIGRTVKTWRELPQGAKIGSSSPRRQAWLKHMRPDLNVVNLRGNVETRLRKVRDGEVDGTLLAVAGLKRLGLLDAASSVLDIDEFLPAAGQGAIGIEIRSDDARTRALVAAINDADTETALITERSFLDILDGTCRTPIAGHARIDGDTIHFRGMIAKTDGSEVLETARHGSRTDAATLGADAGRELKSRAGPGFFVEG
ncbi:MAG TPA: hydroxymethylbilane synthase [Xanthobacteraceae bacterium]|jgi:hydroxymethylbilane synthase|nr:hydroxymethylbilane synthase [Xanthobacteraceae bacterium]